MLVILEGVDGAGKSHVAQWLADALTLSGDVEIMHKGPMTTDAITEYEVPLEDYASGSGRHIICDRWHTGELVYGPLLRGTSRMHEHERRHIDKFLAVRGAIIVHVLAPENEVRRRLGERGDDLITELQVPEIVDSYHDVFTRLGWNTPVVDLCLLGNDQADRETILEVVQTAARYEILTTGMQTFSTYVGPRTPRILLLGERQNVNKSAGHRAAFVPVSSTSGEYLFRALPFDIDVSCGVANACEEDVVSLYEALGRPLVVALGNESAKECERAEVPYGVVPHPTYVRRFHHGQADAYGRAIREAAHHRRDMREVFR